VHDLLDHGGALDQVARVLGRDGAAGLAFQRGVGEGGDMGLARVQLER
jgi:hypothetical protein